MDLSYEQIVDLIVKDTKLDKNVVLTKIDDKVSELEGLVSKEGAAHIVANELSVSIVSVDAGSDFVEIKNLVGGLRNVIVVGRVVDVYPVNSFKKGEREGRVGGLLLGDGTGLTRVVFWNDQVGLLENIKEGDVLKVINAYVKENKFGRLELHVSYRSKVRINPGDVDVSSIPSQSRISKSFKNIDVVELVEGENVRVSGMIVQVFKKNVFFTVCPDCSKSVKPENGVYMCSEHGKVEPVRKVFLTYVIDDGTGNVRVVSFGRDAEKIIGAATDEVINVANENEDNSYPVEYFNNNIIGKEVIILGKGFMNSFSNSVEIISSRVVYPVNFDSELKRVYSEFEYGDSD